MKTPPELDAIAKVVLKTVHIDSTQVLTFNFNANNFQEC